MRPCPMQLFTLRRSTSCEHLPSLCALNLPAQELPCRKPRQGLWNLSSTKLLVSKAVRLQARHFPNHCARMHRRYCSGIRERFARNFSWPELSLADENAAPDATTTSRNSCRPSSSPDSLSGNQTLAHWSRICILGLPRF